MHGITKRKRDHAQFWEIADQPPRLGQGATIGDIDQDDAGLALGHGIVERVVAAARRGAAIGLGIEAGRDPFREQPYRRIDHDVEDGILPKSRNRSLSSTDRGPDLRRCDP